MAKHLLPVMGPVELALGGLTGFGMRALLTDAHAVHQRTKHREKPEAEDDDADVPHLGERHVIHPESITLGWLNEMRATQGWPKMRWKWLSLLPFCLGTQTGLHT